VGGVLELSLLFIVIGAKGFTRIGLPLSSRTRLSGARGKAVGAACVLIGLSGVGFVYWAGDAGDRQRLRLIGQGIVIGVLGVFLVRGWSTANTDQGNPASDDTDSG
jgi:hypothetical protein